MANSLKSSSAQPGSSRVRGTRRAQGQPLLNWPVIVLVAIIAASVVIGTTVGSYQLSRPRTPMATHVTPAVSPPLAEFQPQPAEDLTPLLRDDDPPKAKSAPTVVATAEYRRSNPETPRAKPPIPPANAGFKKRDHATADELAKQLFLAPEVGIDQATTERLFVTGLHQSAIFPHPPPEPLLHNETLIGLPVRMGLDCHLGKEAAENLQVLSRKLRAYLTDSVPKDGIDTRPDATVLREKLLGGSDGKRGDWKQGEAVPTLMQLLQAEDKPLRLLLVELLADMKCREASAALAQRALFDLSGEVREAAVAALRNRPRDEFREVLVNGLQYPWAVVSDHAAEALVAIGDVAALTMLVDLLDRPNPSGPFVRGLVEQETLVREVVRVNHFRNCILCHAPSAGGELVRASIPDPKQPLPARFSPAYYTAGNMFVRADITYLKQDFAVPQPVARPDHWPTNQRFDYLVRTRPATMRDIEIASRKEPNATYPQRESVLFALRELTGKDAGTSTDAWRPVVAKAMTPIGAEDGR